MRESIEKPKKKNMLEFIDTYGNHKRSQLQLTDKLYYHYNSL